MNKHKKSTVLEKIKPIIKRVGPLKLPVILPKGVLPESPDDTSLIFESEEEMHERGYIA